MPPEPKLCEELGVSRTVIRESVKSLVAKGLVSTGPKVGTRVLPEDAWNWFDPDVVIWQSKAGLTREFLRDLQDPKRAGSDQDAVRAVVDQLLACTELSRVVAILYQRQADQVESLYAAGCDNHPGLQRLLLLQPGRGAQRRARPTELCVMTCTGYGREIRPQDRSRGGARTGARAASVRSGSTRRCAT